MLNVSTGACTSCDGPARVPEDVAAIRQIGGKLMPLIICEKCQPEFERRLREKMEETPFEEEEEE